MSKPIAFRVLGIPKPQPRPRAFVPKGSTHASVYDAGTAEGWKGAVALAAREFLPETPLAGPLFVDILFIMKRPKAHYRTGKFAHVLRPDAPAFHTGKPDRDNLEKAILDALTQLGFWGDDGQVCGGEVRKMYGKHPGADIAIESAQAQAAFEEAER